MNSRLSEIVNEIEDARTALFNTVSELSQKELDEQPTPDQWSVGEVLYHLYLVETQITTLLAKQVEKAKKRGIGPDPNNESLIGSLDRFALEVAEQKFKAPSYAVPQQGIEKKKLVELLQQSRTELLASVSEAASYDLTELVFPHPALGRMNMYEWILFIGKHDDRHRAQIETILNNLGEV